MIAADLPYLSNISLYSYIQSKGKQKLYTPPTHTHTQPKKIIISFLLSNIRFGTFLLRTKIYAILTVIEIVIKIDIE